MLSCLALVGSSHPLGSYVVPEPSPREEAIHLPLHLCGTLWLSQDLGGTRLEGGAPGGEAQTLSLPTAICGGTSRPADPASHWPGRHGRLCSAHDHRAGAAGELLCSGGEVGWQGGGGEEG